jgi:hypothetical protein
MTNRLVDPVLLGRPLEWPRGDDRDPVLREGGIRKGRGASVLALLALLVGAVMTGMTYVPASSASPDDTTCVGLLPPGVYENIVVPRGASCTILGANVTTIRGNILALPDSALDVRDARIHGNVHGDHAENLELHRNTIGGNVHISDGETPHPQIDVMVRGNTLTAGDIWVERMAGDVTVDQNNVQAGNIQAQEMLAAGAPNEEFRVMTNTVAGNIQVFKVMGPRLKFVTNNTVRENLQCRLNDPPFVGTPNLAAHREGQCA